MKMDLNRMKKVQNFIFSIVFLVLLFLPLVFINTEETVVSELENRQLTSWPGLKFDGSLNEWYGHYFEDRVGFRNFAIGFNNLVTYDVFHEFTEDIHMIGKEDHIFPGDEGYVGNYQRTNIDETLMDNLMIYLKNTDAYAKANGAEFVFFIAPNKSSVYGEYMPDNIHVDETKNSTLELAKAKLDETDVKYVIPDEELMEHKQTEVVYNKDYDIAHWNDLGAFYALELLDKKIAEDESDIPIMKMEDFDISSKDVELDFFTIPIMDNVPVFTSKMTALTEGPDQVMDLTVRPGNNIAYYYNENASSDKTLLVLHDSFLDSRESWYFGRYKEVYYGARTNYDNMKEYIDRIQPDVIIFEVAERAFADDLSAYTELATLSYE